MALLAAVTEGDPREVYALISNGANMAAVDADQNTALHLAALNRHTGIVQLLLFKGCDKLMENKDGMTAAVLARQNGAGSIASTIEDFEPSGAVLSEAIAQLDAHICKRFEGIEARVAALK
eukprot:TRINITY_DN15110_c0_g1_i2.p2 TRINITY_DN15110_c0_g1~~TRINITY_DN15110_c0_g1_i2.p2  ORF type:complete len:121 (+),score=29.39 TRINITY_DN15110_c0_g1_i2:205-567(+)